MRLFRNLEIFVYIFFASTIFNVAQAEDYRSLEDFIKQNKYEFKLLLSKSPPEIAEKWNKEYSKYVKSYVEKGEMLQYVKSILKKEGKFDEGIFAYSYLNESHELQLERWTQLSNGLGLEYFNYIYKENLETIDSDIQSKFDKIENLSKLPQIASLLSEYFKIKREIQMMREFPKVKYTFKFEPISSPYSDEPDLVKEYKLYDWLGQSKEIPKLKEALWTINDNLIIEHRTRPKDPLFPLTILTQFAFLLAIIPGYILTYTEKRPVLVISLLVIVSIVSSFILIFISPSTWLNIMIQSMVPCIFGFAWLYSYLKRKKSIKLINKNT